VRGSKKNGCGNKARWHHHGGTIQKGKFFVTGEVFLLDIGLLMGAIGQSLFRFKGKWTDLGYKLRDALRYN
jgi:hypothetical protein